MLKTVLVSALAAASGFAGWMGGSIWPAPPEWTDAVDRTATDLRARFRLERVSFDGLRDLLPAERFAEIKSEMTQLAVATGELIVVDRSPGTLEEQLDNLALDAASAVPDGMEVMTLPAAPPPAATAGATPEAGATAATTPPAPSPVPSPPGATQVVVPSAPPAVVSQVFPTKLELCPRMDVSNAPSSAQGVVSNYRQFVRVK